MLRRNFQTWVRPAVLAAGMMGPVVLLAGCHQQQEGFWHVLKSVLPARQARQTHLEPMTYPQQAPVGRPWDIELVRIDRRQVRIVNRTTRHLSGLTLFFNRQYGGVVDDLPVGQPVVINLLNFVNAYGERFPVGSFLEPEKSRVIVLADAFVDGQLHKLTVHLPEDWQEAGPAGGL